MPYVFLVQYNFTVDLKGVSGEEKLFRYQAEVYMNIDIDREYRLLVKGCLSTVSTLQIQSM